MTIRILGLSVSSLVTAIRLANLGESVELHTRRESLSRGWGGYTTDFGEADIGQRFFELGYENNTQDSNVDNYKKNGFDIRPFSDLVRNFIEAELALPLVEVPVESLFRGKIIKCPLETVSLSEAIALLTPSEKTTIYNEISGFTIEQTRMMDLLSHPYTRLDESRKALSFGSVIDKFHGEMFNAIFINDVLRFFDVRKEELPLYLRRKCWLPYYHPKTICEVIADDKEAFVPYRPHYGLKGSNTSKFLTVLYDKVVQHKNIRVTQINKPSFTLSEIGSFLSRQSYELIDLSLRNISEIEFLKQLEHCELSVSWFALKEQHILRRVSYLSILNCGNIFRVSSTEATEGLDSVILCVEHRHSIESEFIRRFLSEELSLCRNPENLVPIGNISVNIPKPTFKNADDFDRAQQYVFSEIGLKMGGFSRPFGIDSLSDQIIGGICNAEEIRC
jgi:hypothetical protein